jgi:hypothetical protein
MKGFGENTPLACGFRRRAENFAPQIFTHRTCLKK